METSFAAGFCRKLTRIPESYLPPLAAAPINCSLDLSPQPGMRHPEPDIRACAVLCDGGWPQQRVSRLRPLLESMEHSVPPGGHLCLGARPAFVPAAAHRWQYSHDRLLEGPSLLGVHQYLWPQQRPTTVVTNGYFAPQGSWLPAALLRQDGFP